MNVISLDAEVDHAEVLASGGDDGRLAKREIDVAAAEAVDVPDHPGRHVPRMPAIVLGSRHVALAGTLSLRLAPGAPALAAVRAELHLDLTTLRASLAHGAALPDDAASPPRDLD